MWKRDSLAIQKSPVIYLTCSSNALMMNLSISQMSTVPSKSFYHLLLALVIYIPHLSQAASSYNKSVKLSSNA